ncbi:uncharacterized protein CHSO_1077 [Chryseobacterium sp. StRB126]|uniref:hypothetical protein n=1 Tax=Chryseobacterium sp. StRB126 TaxID=878220 RepID=UPI0004E98D4E|nr:hypothetical protein [Chryseobacterium sp. StRB126]BAP30114.1 uncharacterized protein CHSO_1077 [Chryseobacterium sp. StRB126]
MIAPQELRIGNILNAIATNGIETINFYEIKVNEILTDGIREEKGLKFPYHTLVGTLLTEEWLLKFGFEKRDDDKYYHHKYDRTWVKIESCIVKWYGNAVGGLVMIDYVHQLQNCFNIFTSEELTIKEQ